MKLRTIFISMAICLCLLSVSFAGDSLIKPTIKHAITTAGYTAVLVPDGVENFRSFGIWTADGSDYYVSKTGSDDDAIPVIDGGKWMITYETKKTFGSGDGTICYVKGTASTDIVGLVE